MTLAWGTLQSCRPGVPRLRIVIGANGAGKTTWCGQHPDRVPGPFYDADSIAQGLGSHDSIVHQRAARRMVDRMIEEHLERREDFGFESTYSGASRPEIVRRAHQAGYQVEAIYLGTSDPAINVGRVAARVRDRSGHRVSPGEIRRRWMASQENLVATSALFHTIHLYDNSEETMSWAVLLGEEGASKFAADAPAWARALEERVRAQRPAPTLESNSKGPMPGS